MDREAKLAEIESLQARLGQLEAEVHDLAAGEVWTPPKYYTAYEMMGGMVLGLIAAGASLLFNVIGGLMFGKHALELIRVYLTFPMGEPALELENGFALAAGVCLYLMTGMSGGIPIHMILSRYFKQSSGMVRFVAATVLGIGVWLVNFYGFLYWAQPLLIDGQRYIVDNIPIYVAIATHLIFAWVMLALHRWGQFVPYAARQEQ
jgi:hypothetical protein